MINKVRGTPKRKPKNTVVPAQIILRTMNPTLKLEGIKPIQSM